MKKERLTGSILLFSFIALIILYFWEALAQSNLMVERDLSIFFFPNLKLWVDAVKAGELPLWNPYSFSGQPLFASLQTSILYPPNILLLILPLDFAFNLTIVLHFILSGWFVYLLTRELGGSRLAGTLACLSFTLGGFLLSIHNVLNTLQSATWTPLVFFFFLRALRERSWKYPVLSILTILVQFMGGGIEAFLLTQALLLFLAFFPQSLLPRQAYHSWKRRLPMIGVIFLLFIGLGTVQIIPFWEMTRNSLRYIGFSYQDATRWSLGWMDLLYIFLPDFFWRGIEYYKTDQNYLKSIYLGVIPFMMVLFFFLGRDRRKGWFGLFLAVSLLLALGRNTPLYRWLYTLVPGIQMIRYPVKFFFITNLFICLLTGLGWDALTARLQEDPQKKQSTLKKVSLVLAFFFVLVLLILFLFRSSLIGFLESSFPVGDARPWGLNLHNLERFSFFALLAFLFFVFFADGKISVKKGQTVLVVLLILDLFLANWGFYRRVDPKAFYSLSPNLQAVLSDPEKGRIYVDPMMSKTEVPQKVEMDGLIYYILKENFYFEYPLVHKIFNTSGFGIMTYHPYQDLLTVLNEKGSHPGATDILRLMNVKYILWHEAAPDPALKLIRKGESYVMPIGPPNNIPHRPKPYRTIVAHLYENKTVLPRVFLAPQYRVVKNGKERIDLFSKKGFNPAETVLLEETPEPPRPGQGSLPDHDDLRISKYQLNQMELKASCTGPRILFLSETYYPGWKVRVDGEEGKIYRANHAFRAIALGPGHHTIRLYYDPFSVKLGLAITIATLIGMLGFYFDQKKKIGKRMIPQLSVVFPVYNEETILKDNLLQCVQVLEQTGIDFEIILVDDGSEDGTPDIGATIARQDSRVRLLTIGKNHGKGGALKEGVMQSRGRTVLFSDIDLAVSFQELQAFLKAINQGYDLAIGSRKAPGAKILVHQPFIRETLGRGFTALSRFILGLQVSDFTCGFKVFKGSAAKDLFFRLTLSDWSFDAELLYLSEVLGYRRIEIPVTWSNRPESRVRLRKDLLTSLLGLFRIRWRHRKLKLLRVSK